MDDLAILRLADGVARHSATRHRIISDNIANADTPGYKARDIEPFSAAYERAQPMKTTREGHVGAADRRTFSARPDSATGAISPNGNDVSLGDQMVRATKAMGAHDRAMTVYKKTLDILRLSLGSGR
jgi:flagellar basal-body rod protein FlgB